MGPASFWKSKRYIAEAGEVLTCLTRTASDECKISRDRVSQNGSVSFTTSPPPTTMTKYLEYLAPSEETKVWRFLVLLLRYILTDLKFRNGWLRSSMSDMYVSKSQLYFAAHSPSQTVLQYGWIPLIIYVGYTRSNPQPSLIKCVR